MSRTPSARPERVDLDALRRAIEDGRPEEVLAVAEWVMGIPGSSVPARNAVLGLARAALRRHPGCPSAIGAHFAAGQVMRTNLRAHVADLDAFNAAILDVLEETGFQPDGKGERGISDDHRFIIPYDTIDIGTGVIGVLTRIVDRAIAAYRAELGAAQVLPPVEDRACRLSMFAAATRAAGYHYPHTHSRAAVVATYYVRVPKGGEAELRFGHTIFPDLPHTLAVTPREGDLVLFPGHLAHATTAPGTDIPRVNIGYDLVEA